MGEYRERPGGTALCPFLRVLTNLPPPHNRTAAPHRKTVINILIFMFTGDTVSLTSLFFLSIFNVQGVYTVRKGGMT